MQPDTLRAFRERHSLSQKRLEELLPSGAGSVKQWESGRFAPPKYLQRALRDLERELTEQPASD